MKNLFAIALATALASPVVCSAAESDRDAMQKRLDAECEAARERRLAPERAKYIDECLRENPRTSREECERFYSDHGAQAGKRAPLYTDLPECERAFKFRETYRQ